MSHYVQFRHADREEWSTIAQNFAAREDAQALMEYLRYLYPDDFAYRVFSVDAAQPND